MNKRRTSLFSIVSPVLLAVLTACGTLLVEVRPEGGTPTPLAAASPTPRTDEPEPYPAPGTPQAPGLVRGAVCFPSETVPPMTAYFQEVASGAIQDLEIARDQTSYSQELPAGSYIAFAYLVGDDFGGHYSQAVPCGLSVDCQDHSPIVFEVPAGGEVDGVDLCDWYAPDAVPPRPFTSQVDLAGLVYSALAGGMVQVGPSGQLVSLPDGTPTTISQDGKLGAFERAGDLWIFDIQTGQERNLTGTPDRLETGPQWWPQRPGTLVFGSWDVADELVMSTGYLSIIQSDGSGFQVLDPEQASNTYPSPGPDGETIAYDRGGEPWLYRLGSGPEAFETGEYGLESTKGIQAGSPAWSPDGSRLAWWVGGGFGEATLALAVFDLQAGAVTLLHPFTPVSGGGGWLAAPVWSPDGSWLAALTRGEIDRTNLWVLRADGGEEHPLGRAESPVWSPDGSVLAYALWPDQGDVFQDVQPMLARAGNWSPQQAALPPGSFPRAWLDVQVPVAGGDGPKFAPEVFFAREPDLGAARRVFPPGTTQVYALWSYEGMQAGMTIRRDWYLDEVLWLSREEPWDFAKYGASGIVEDISIFDFEAGLPSGTYRLRLYIDGQEQTIMESRSSSAFEIVEPIQLLPKPSPDGSRLAVVEPPGRLIIERTTGEREPLLEVEEISSLAWFPDGEHLVYSVRDRAEQLLEAGPVGVADSLWVVDLETGETHEIASLAENLHDPLVSPDGRYVAAIGGTGYADACFVDRSLWVLELDDQQQVTFSYYQLNFEGLPDAGSVYVKNLLTWSTDTRLRADLGWVCAPQSQDGIYVLDLASRRAEKEPTR